MQFNKVIAKIKGGIFLLHSKHCYYMSYIVIITVIQSHQPLKASTAYYDLPIKDTAITESSYQNLQRLSCFGHGT